MARPSIRNITLVRVGDDDEDIDEGGAVSPVTDAPQTARSLTPKIVVTPTVEGKPGIGGDSLEKDNTRKPGGNREKLIKSSSASCVGSKCSAEDNASLGTSVPRSVGLAANEGVDCGVLYYNDSSTGMMISHRDDGRGGSHPPAAVSFSMENISEMVFVKKANISSISSSVGMSLSASNVSVASVVQRHVGDPIANSTLVVSASISKPMVTASQSYRDNSKNFRHQFLQKLGHGVEPRKLIEEALQESIVDRSKLASLVGRLDAPGICRLPVWETLLGIIPCCREMLEPVWLERIDQCRILVRALRVMRMIDYPPPPQTITNDVDDGSDQAKSPESRTDRRPSDIGNEPNVSESNIETFLNSPFPDSEPDRLVKMFLLEQGMLPYDLSLISTGTGQHFGPLTSVVLELTPDPYKQYWLARSIAIHFEHIWRVFGSAIVGLIVDKLSKNHPDLVAHLTLENPPALDFFLSHIFKTWILSGLACIFPELSIVKLWDKVIAGNFPSISFVLIRLFFMHKSTILSSTSPTELDTKLRRAISDESALNIVNKGVDDWKLAGSLANF